MFGNAEDAPESAPQKVERPRDEFGRPLPAGSVSRLRLEDFDALSIEENHQLGKRYFNERQFFGAHEAWETAWREARGSKDEEFFKGLSQLGAGYTHYQRGNAHGAQALVRRGLERIAQYGSAHRGIDINTLARDVAEQADRFEAAERREEAPPQINPPKL